MNLLKDKVWSWGYVLDHVPTAAPFTFGKTKCSLERENSYLGVKHCFYMNSMFSSDYIHKYFPYWEEECVANCIDNRLSDFHMGLLADMDEIYCTLEHLNYFESAKQIARLSLKYKNIKGIHIDDFNNGNKMTELTYDELKRLKESALEINPELKLAVVSYSHFKAENQIAPFADLLDVVSRWCWVASEDYWDQHEDDIKTLRDALGPDKKIIQGIYIHDFGSCMKSHYPVPLKIFQKSIATICEDTYAGILDGFIIPQAGWFSSPKHFEHISWMKQYFDWFEGTSDIR